MTQYENFKFLLKWDGRVVAAVNKISVIKRTIQPIKKNKQGNEDLSSRFYKKKNHPALVLKGGVSHDPEFEKWANEAPNHLRKDIIIQHVMQAGRNSLVYKINRCWVSEYRAIPYFDVNSFAVAIEHIKIENEGCEKISEATR